MAILLYIAEDYSQKGAGAPKSLLASGQITICGARRRHTMKAIEEEADPSAQPTSK